MKLSELLKNNPEVSSPTAVFPAEPLPKTVAKPTISSEVPSAPAPMGRVSPPSAEEIENKIRNGLEKEFFEKMKLMEESFKRLSEEQLLTHQQMMQSRERLLETEKQRLADELQLLKASHENLSVSRRMQEEDLQKKLGEERQRIEKELKDRFERSLQEKTEQIQGLIQDKKKSEENLPPPPVPAQEISFSLNPAPVPQTDLKPVSSGPSANSEQILSLSPEQEKIIRCAYQELIKSAELFFDGIVSSKGSDLQLCKKNIREILGFMEIHDNDFLAIVLEPYPSEKYFAYHAVNCALLSMMIALELKMPMDKVGDVSLASLIQDVGLLGISDRLDHPRPLAPELKNEILQHSERSFEMLRGVSTESVLTGVLQHHEAMNGQGYPKGLAGEQIDSFARIMHVADSFEAMTHYRPYRQKPLEVNQALREMVDRGRGVYDRDSMKALMSRIGLYPVMSLVELSNHKIARVVRQSRKFPLSPVVRIEFDEDGNKVRAPFLVDLSKNQLIHIHGPVGHSKDEGEEKIEKLHAEPVRKKGFEFLEFIPFLILIIFLTVAAYLILKL